MDASKDSNMCAFPSCPLASICFNVKVTIKKKQSWKYNGCDPYTEPRLVTSAVELPQSEDISDGIRNA